MYSDCNAFALQSLYSLLSSGTLKFFDLLIDMWQRTLRPSLSKVSQGVSASEMNYTVSGGGDKLYSLTHCQKYRRLLCAKKTTRIDRVTTKTKLRTFLGHSV